jgi:hypothetical protein
VFISAFGILCAFALVVFAAAGARSYIGPAVAAAGAVLTWFVLPAGSLPDPVWGALAILLLTALLLLQPERRMLASAGAGASAAAWLALLVGQGLPALPSFAVTLGVAAAVFALNRRDHRFAPDELVEEALLVCLAYSMLIACWPAVSSGYGSAIVFTTERVSAPDTTSAPWALQLSLSLIVLGGLYGFWKRRR